MMFRRMSKHEISDLAPSMRLRVLNLVGAVGIYQTHLHPRDMKNYKDDTFSAVQISKFLVPARGSEIQENYELNPHYTAGSSFHIEVVGIMGDTLLSGATWLAGVNLAPMDVYDSCVVVLSVPPHHPGPGRTPSRTRTIAIPAARVFSVTPYTATDDSEKRQPIFVPRGAGHGMIAGHRLEWIYWIPCGSGLWLLFWSEKQTLMGGRVEVKVVSDADVNLMLAAGTLNIGFREVADVKAVVDVSREVMKCLLRFVDGNYAK